MQMTLDVLLLFCFVSIGVLFLYQSVCLSVCQSVCSSIFVKPSVNDYAHSVRAVFCAGSVQGDTGEEMVNYCL